MARYRHPRLVGVDNRGYLVHSSEHARDARAPRVRDSGAVSASARIAVVFEEIVRAALARVVALSDDRILAYEEAEWGGGYARRYRELDAVSVDDGVRVFEIKASRSENAALRGTRQLGKTGAILRTGTPGRSKGVRLALLWVDTGGSPQREMDWFAATSPADLAAALGGTSVDERVRLARIAAHRAWSWKGELGVAADEGLWHEFRAEAEIADHRRTLTEAGVDSADWPEELREPERVVARWETDAGNTPKDSVMADALRRVLNQPPD